MTKIDDLVDKCPTNQPIPIPGRMPNTNVITGIVYCNNSLDINRSNTLDEPSAGNFKLSIVVTVAMATISSNDEAPNINVDIPFFLA